MSSPTKTKSESQTQLPDPQSSIDERGGGKKSFALHQYRIPSPIQSPAVSRRNLQTADDAYEGYDSYTPTRPQRQQPQSSSRLPPRPSSSSGSARTIRRTPKLENLPRPRAASLPRQFSEEGGGSTTPRTTRANSPSPESYWPRRSTRISRRTASAILFALEEAIRTPFPFSPDLEEENALMSDLVGGGPIPSTNGRAQNGASRAATGPVPAPQQPVQRVMTPTDIMRLRNERIRQKKAEDDAKKQQEATERERLRQGARSSVERREAAGVAGPDTGEVPSRRSRVQSGQRISGGDVPVIQDAGEDRRRVPLSAQTTLNSNTPGLSGIPVATDGAGGPTTSGRTRGATVSQPQPTPRPVQPATSRAPSASATYTQPQTSQARLGGSAAGTNQAQAGGPSVPPSTSQRPQPSSGAQPRVGTASAFPHAFERWETLSSNWEGLTSFWIRRLQANSEDLREPINQQLARQVTDLSAAGANLFHAVVELQRLRASSERKFQRWFFETRTEQERTQERIAELEGLLRAERQSHASVDAATLEAERAAAEQIKASAGRVRITAERQVAEVRRELQISKDEARRAWEELGRREQEERERTASLRAGEATLVGGVKVVPMALATPSSRQVSSSRPPARDGPLPGQTGLSGNPTHARQDEPLDSPGEGEVGYTNYDPARSETDTDPFTENGRDAPRSSSDVPPVPVISQSYQQITSSAAAQAAARTATTTYTTSPSRPIISAPSAPPTSQAGGTYLSYGPSGAAAPQPPASQAQGGSFYQHADTALLPTAPSAVDPTARATAIAPPTQEDQRSYVPSIEDDQLSEEDEYELDERGNVRVDAAGNPIIARRLGGLGSEDSDEYDVQDSLAREQAYRRQYDPASTLRAAQVQQRPTGGVFTQGPSGQSTYAPSRPGPTQGSLQRPVDYSGSGYGSGWEAVPRHHHPTRLSDVLEEDERSRTSPSRASQRSGGLR
ncbi:MAG: hypothetical protein MMC33_009599 [Icmadophila ericetorum]|nr:hypothetical protein [Icmadophila ericetorum]